jgi:polyisoprenoid-binding protein YceI
MLESAMIRPLFLFLFFLSLSAVVGAADRYRIDPDHTYSSFEYKHWGLSLQRGRFDKNIGFIELDMAEKTGAINIEIDANSVSTGNELFNNIMRSDSFFDAQAYPKIIFNSTKFVFDEERLTQIEGALTIKETTRPVVVEVTQFGCRFMILYLKQACGANGQTKILRSDYKMGRYAPFVSDEITLYFSVEAIKE